MGIMLYFVTSKNTNCFEKYITVRYFYSWCTLYIYILYAKRPSVSLILWNQVFMHRSWLIYYKIVSNFATCTLVCYWILFSKKYIVNFWIEKSLEQIQSIWIICHITSILFTIHLNRWSIAVRTCNDIHQFPVCDLKLDNKRIASIS